MNVCLTYSYGWLVLRWSDKLVMSTLWVLTISNSSLSVSTWGSSAWGEGHRNKVRTQSNVLPKRPSKQDRIMESHDSFCVDLITLVHSTKHTGGFLAATHSPFLATSTWIPHLQQAETKTDAVQTSMIQA